MTILRMFAQIIDLIISLAVFVLLFKLVPFVFSSFGIIAGYQALLTCVLTVLLLFLIQLPFLMVHQTIGKAFFALRIEPIDDKHEVTISIILQRELFLKLATLYLVCLPVLFGKKGAHELSTWTKITRTRGNPGLR